MQTSRVESRKRMVPALSMKLSALYISVSICEVAMTVDTCIDDVVSKTDVTDYDM